jgi:Fe-S-cluster-containing dehydrogenase component
VGDARSPDGTVSFQQPLIAPLYDGKSAIEVLDAMMKQQPVRDDYDIVRAYWRAQKLWPDFEAGWRRALHDGLIAGTAFPEKQVRLRAGLSQTAHSRAQTANGQSAIELAFRPDASVWDGRYANNGFLQECARPVNKLTWDNAVVVSPALAQRLHLMTDDLVEVKFEGRALRGPVWVMPGQATNSITLHLGYGRQRIGRVGKGVGFNATALRTGDSFWGGSGVTLTKLGGRHHLVTTQTHHNVDSPDRQVYRQGTLAQFLAAPEFVKRESEAPAREDTLYYPGQYPYNGYKWAMSIDLTACIGCNACLLACEVENNIPVVGREQVNVHREMYWIRIDTYYKGTLDNPEFNHIPVPCMQCEHAPCELVCPVEATVHDHEGLNPMIYNRCIGTRFCSNNCPYKVRRFNFLRYTDYHTPSLKPMYNPEVTVRWRGVMEKCTYCVQRITRGRIRAEKENRQIRDLEVRTACQDTCPARAIVFGDLNTPGSQVARLRAHPLQYAMLGELNTRPRTTYLAKLQNRNPQIEHDRPV